MKISKFKPIRIFCPEYGYGWWWKNYFYFVGKGSTAFAIVPMYRYCNGVEYAFDKGGVIIGHGDTLSWSDSRQKQLAEFKQEMNQI